MGYGQWQWPLAIYCIAKKPVTRGRATIALLDSKWDSADTYRYGSFGTPYKEADLFRFRRNPIEPLINAQEITVNCT